MLIMSISLNFPSLCCGTCDEAPKTCKNVQMTRAWANSMPNVMSCYILYIQPGWFDHRDLLIEYLRRPEQDTDAGAVTAVTHRMHHTDSGGLGLHKRGLEIMARPAGIDEAGNCTTFYSLLMCCMFCCCVLYVNFLVVRGRAEEILGREEKHSGSCTYSRSIWGWEFKSWAGQRKWPYNAFHP